MKIGVLMGGNSSEREISLKSGRAVAETLLASGTEVTQIDTQNIGWMQELLDVEFVFIALHGSYGEDGRIQAYLELKNIPYSGSGVLSSALGMDKLRSKQLWKGTGIATPDFYAVDNNTDFGEVIQSLGPVFIKPVSEGSSLGMSIARTPEEAREATVEASRLGSGVIAEHLVEGAEYTVAILGDQALPIICIETDNSFYDYDAKYVSEYTRYICPCGLKTSEEEMLKRLALKAFDTLGCRVWGRVDVMQEENGDFLVLEINTVPGLTTHSLVPMAAKAANISMENLIKRIVDFSLEAHRS